MKDWFNKKYAAMAIYAFLVIAAALLFSKLVNGFGFILDFFYTFLGMIASFIIGFAIAYLLNPSYTFLRSKVFSRIIKPEKKRTIKTLSLLSLYIIVLGLVSFLLYIVIPQFYSSIRECVANITTNYQTYYDNLNNLIESVTMGQLDISHLLSDWGTQLLEYLKSFQLSDILPLTNFAMSLTSGVFKVIIGFIISIYFLYNKELFCAQIKKTGYALLNRRSMHRLERLFGTGHTAMGKYFTGVLIDALVVGFTITIVTAIFGIPYPVLIGVICGFTNMIPFFGPYIGGAPCVLLVLMIDPIKALILVAIMVVIQQIDGNFIAPKIIGQKTGLSAVWVIFAILVGGGFFGVLGMLLGVPVFSIIYLFFSNFIKQRLESKKMSPSTADYFANADEDKKYCNKEKDENDEQL